ncbi:MAG TPA: hypothetical protein DDX98_07380 [Bacteroidales bacterium]|jgi:seryl-tRNA synthetase|nr:hypothetical protein [Bacteroidales bacterium]
MSHKKKIRFIKTNDNDYKKLLHEHALLQEEHNKLIEEVENKLKAWVEMSGLINKREELIEEVEQLTLSRDSHVNLMRMIPVHELDISKRLKTFF